MAKELRIGETEFTLVPTPHRLIKAAFCPAHVGVMHDNVRQSIFFDIVRRLGDEAFYIGELVNCQSVAKHCCLTAAERCKVVLEQMLDEAIGVIAIVNAELCLVGVALGETIDDLRRPTKRPEAIEVLRRFPNGAMVLHGAEDLINDAAVLVVVVTDLSNQVKIRHGIVERSIDFVIVRHCVMPIATDLLHLSCCAQH